MAKVKYRIMEPGPPDGPSGWENTVVRGWPSDELATPFINHSNAGTDKMGMIKIELTGSFGNEAARNFSAMDNGHAAAVARAIQWLSEDVLPVAIRSDHDLHEAGANPNGPFGHDD